MDSTAAYVFAIGDVRLLSYWLSCDRSGEWVLNSSTRRVVFFDLDGTLHQQDMFGSFLRYALRHQPLNALLLLPLLPVIAAGLMLYGRAARWPPGV